MKVSRVRVLALGGVCAALLSSTAGSVRSQPNPLGRPNYGSVALRSGFTPDPYEKGGVVSGGDVRSTFAGLTQYVDEPPDFRLNFTAGSFDKLYIKARSPGDVTLLVNLPDGTWLADDDSDGMLNPKVTVRNPRSGQYDIWVGTLRQGTGPTATIVISELR
jgi:hypothetical protein